MSRVTSLTGTLRSHRGSFVSTALAAPTGFVHEQIVGDSTHTYLSWTAVSGADVYNVRLESDNSIFSLRIAGAAGSGAYAGKLVYTLGTGTGGEPALTPSTLYRVYITALKSDGTRESSGSTVDGAMTADSTGGLATNTPSFLPILPWAAGPGASCVGGSGRDSISGGNAAAQTIYLCGTVSELRTACNATGRRWAILYKSGVYDIGTGVDDADGEVEIRNDGLITIIDLSPSPGAIVMGGAFPIWNNNGAGLSTRGQDIAFLNMRVYDKARNVGNGFAIGLQENAATYRRIFLGYSNWAYSYDQIVTMIGKTDDCGLFGCMVFKAIADSVHPTPPHSTGIIVEWIGECTNFGVIHCVLSDNAWRNPLTGAAQALLADNVLHNFEVGMQIRQANDEFTSGFPTFTTIQGNVFIRGVNGSGAQPVDIGGYPSYGDALHSGSRVCMRGNAGIGYTDSTQAALAPNSQSGISIESSPVPGTPTLGYAYNAVTLTTDGRAGRAALILGSSGAWPAVRDTAAQTVINGVNASIASAGTGGQIIDEGGETYPSLVVNTADFTTGADPAPGISAMTTGGFALGSAGRVIQTSGAYINYTAFEAWMFRRLSSVPGVHA